VWATFSTYTGVLCDHLYVIAENVSLADAPTALQITASQVPALTITSENESLAYQGLTNTSLGNAAMAATTNLVITNLGSSGQDGVSIAMPGGISPLETEWEPLDASNTLPVGAYIQEQVIGMANGITNGLLGTATMTKSGTANYSLSADFSPIGASKYTVQAYLHGASVSLVTKVSGVLLGTACIEAPAMDYDPVSNTVSYDWTSVAGGTCLTITGGSALTCDQLFITPENVGSVIATTALQFVASQVPAITITSEGSGAGD
jgi:hypothetical protein